MRPKSIIMFEVFFLIGITVAYFDKWRGITKATLALDQTRAFEMFGGAANVTYAALAVWPVIYLLIWFFIARRASKFAKWVFVTISLSGVVLNTQVFARIGEYSNGRIAIILTISLLQIAAIAMLFRPDAREWFDGKGPVDPNVFR